MNGNVVPLGGYVAIFTSGANVGTYGFSASGLGNYTGSASISFTINPASLKTCTMTLSPSEYTYDGPMKDLSITVVDSNGRTLVENKDYEQRIREENSTTLTGSIVVEGMGNYTDTLSAGYTIKPASIAAATVTLSPTV